MAEIEAAVIKDGTPPRLTWVGWVLVANTGIALATAVVNGAILVVGWLT